MSTSPSPVTAAELEGVRNKLKAKGFDPLSATRGQIANSLNVSDRRARTYQEKLRAGAETLPGKSEVKGDDWTITLPKTRINTVEELIKSFEVDTQIWEIERFVVNAWDMGFKNDLGEAGSHQLYQAKAWLKRKAGVSDAKKQIELLKAEAKAEARVYKPFKSRTLTGNLLEITIPDLHLGKLAWGIETGGDNFDVDIAERVFTDALEALVSRTNSYEFEKILFVVGNDLLHSDTKAGTTTAGTPLDNDGRYHRSFIKARKMITRAIERLRSIAPIDVVVVPGNHDTLSCWHLGDSLECTFAKCPDVKVDNTPNFRKYYQFGKVMLMLTHGNKGKIADYPLTMATEQPVMFGNTEFREAHTGDKHQLKVQELHGVRVRISPALCSADAWHSENLFIGNQRQAEAFIWNFKQGLLGTAIYTVPSDDREK